MSRTTFYRDNRLVAVKGNDHMLGRFIQVYDKEMESVTPEGEGIVLDWSQGFGMERNLTGLPSELNPIMITINYIKSTQKIT